MVLVSSVGSGLVASLAHLGGKVTGLSLMTTDISANRLQLLDSILLRADEVIR